MVNALEALPPNLDQSVLESELKRLIGRHGPVAVRKAAMRLCKGRKGRKPEQDWRLLDPFMMQDAEDWLDGKDPCAIRTNYAIAREFAKQHPGHNPSATHRRIMGKLARKRRWSFLWAAWHKTLESRPFADHFRTVDALAAVDPVLGESVVSLADMYRGRLDRYRRMYGEPAPDMTIKAINEAVTRMDTRTARQITLGELVALGGHLPESSA